MPLEIGDYITDLVPTNPPNTDDLSEADDHMRLIKKTVQQSFPLIDAAVNVTPTDLNAVAGLATALFGKFIQLDWYDTPGSTAWNKPPECRDVLVIVTGAGGGSGATGGPSGSDRAGGGGGGGGTAIAWVKADTLAASENVTVGQGGSAGVSGGANGGAGGTSSFGAVASATGGGGGTNANGVSAAGGAAGAGTVGAIQLFGSDGGVGPLLAANAIGGGTGGTSFFGAARRKGEGDGLPGYTPGGGAAGGSRQSVSGSGTNGAVGGNGGVLVISFGGSVTL